MNESCSFCLVNLDIASSIAHLESSGSFVMGSACCCLRAEDFEDYISRNAFLHRNCICFNCFLQNFLHMYASLFGREVSALPSSIQGAAALTTTSTDNSSSNIYRSPPRPLPYDSDPRYFRVQRDGLVSRREKGSSHSHEESEPLRRNDIDADSESFATGDKWSACDDGAKELHKSSEKLSSSRKSANDIAYANSSSEDEDICPTCLEEYTEENPKILTKMPASFPPKLHI